MNNLRNKRILFFAPDFFGYDIEIKKKIEEFGAKVDLYNDRPNSSFFIKAIIRLKRDLIKRIINRYFENILQKNKDVEFDYVFILKGEAFSETLLKKYKAHFRKAKFILYMWDSLDNYDVLKQNLNLFDKVLSFDLEDSKKYSLVDFRPLFYVDDYAVVKELSNIKIENDLLFIGTVHSDRWVFLNTILNQAKSLNLKVNYYLYIQSPILFIIRKLFDPRFRNIPYSLVKFSSISKDKVIDLVEKSKVVIDIQHPLQTGLTMRSVEVFGAKRKLITTNESIKYYDLFNNNVLIVDRNKPEINLEFYQRDFDKIEEKTYNKYSLNGWVLDVFNA